MRRIVLILITLLFSGAALQCFARQFEDLGAVSTPTKDDESVHLPSWEERR